MKERKKTTESEALKENDDVCSCITSKLHSVIISEIKERSYMHACILYKLYQRQR